MSLRITQQFTLSSAAVPSIFGVSRKFVSRNETRAPFWKSLLILLTYRFASITIATRDYLGSLDGVTTTAVDRFCFADSVSDPEEHEGAERPSRNFLQSKKMPGLRRASGIFLLFRF
jgi:hypothetical protein